MSPEHARPETTRTEANAAPARTPAAPAAQKLSSRALSLQRMIGNRAAGRVLSRWVKHPDEEKKQVMVPDSSAEEFLRFNPPQNK